MESSGDTTALTVRVFVAAIRVTEWWSYKLPPLFAIAYCGLVAGQVTLGNAALLLAALLTLFSSMAAYGYFVNDVCDKPYDNAVRKTNVAGSLSRSVQIVVVLLLLAVAITVTILMRSNTLFFGLVCIEITLLTAYSAQPMRLKERRILGVLCDALYAHTIPMSLVLTAVGQHSAAAFALAAAPYCLTWTFATGLRNILMHQSGHAAIDRRAGLRTFGADLSGETLDRIAIAVLFLLEIPSFGVMVWFLHSLVPSYVYIVLLGATLTCFRIHVFWGKKPHLLSYKEILVMYGNVLMNGLSESCLAIPPLISLFRHTPGYVWLLGLHIVLFFLPRWMSSAPDEETKSKCPPCDSEMLT